MKIKDVSYIAGRSVITIEPDATIRQATEKLVQNKKIEWQRYHQRVSEYEMERYLPLL